MSVRTKTLSKNSSIEASGESAVPVLDDDRIERTIKDIGESKYVAVGIDMAAQEDNWGLAVVSSNNELTQASLHLVLPCVQAYHHRETPKSKLLKPTGEFIKKLLAKLKAPERRTVVAVDVPFGWPMEQRSFLNSWSAVTGCNLPPQREEFEYRLCDRKAKESLIARNEGQQETTRTDLFSVAADKIASASFVWAEYRTLLGSLVQVDVGLQCDGELPDLVFFETYPSLFVRLNYPRFASYKSGYEKNGESDECVRQELLNALFSDYSFSPSHCTEALALECSTKKSDAFDGFVSAITAVDYLRWRTNAENAPPMFSPDAILGQDKLSQQRERIEREGWILVKCPPALINSQHNPSRMSRSDHA